MSEIDRRDFLASAPAAMFLAGEVMSGAPNQNPGAERRTPSAQLEPFDYRGVTLRPGRWKAQSDAAREFYHAVPDDDILHGYRAAAGLAAPGQPLGGWCGRDSNTVFGQWLSGMARMYRATGDARMRDKAVRLMTEWAKTVKPDGDARHGSLSLRQAGLRARRSAALRRSRSRRSASSRKSRTSRAGRSIGRTTWPIRRTTPRTTACPRSGTRSPRISFARIG